MGIRFTQPVMLLTTATTADVTTTNAFADALIIDLQGIKEKSLQIKNTGGANGLSWQILGSLDGGANYDVAVKASANVAFGAVEFYNSSVYCTHWKVQVKDQVGGSHTTASVKLAGIGL